MRNIFGHRFKCPFARLFVPRAAFPLTLRANALASEKPELAIRFRWWFLHLPIYHSNNQPLRTGIESDGFLHRFVYRRKLFELFIVTRKKTVPFAVIVEKYPVHIKSLPCHTSAGHPAPRRSSGLPSPSRTGSRIEYTPGCLHSPEHHNILNENKSSYHFAVTVTTFHVVVPFPRYHRGVAAPADGTVPIAKSGAQRHTIASGAVAPRKKYSDCLSP